MGKILIIAEKPSVCNDFKKALAKKDVFKEEKGFFEGEKYIISYSVGHLLTIMDPREIDLAYRSWSLKNLPILPAEYPIKPIKKTETQLRVLTKLIGRKDVTSIINGCDAGREGELIFRFIMEYSKAKTKGKPIKRLWLQSMTQDAIMEAFSSLKEDDEMQSLYHAARSRAEADWVVGINASRALTAYQSLGGGFVLTPCGRVQTPTLMMMVKRELSRQKFVSKPYFNVKAEFKNGTHSYEGKWFNPSFKEDDTKKELKADRLWNRKEAETLAKKCLNAEAKVSQTEKKSQQKSPLLYDLTSLQREANSRFGLSAKATLSIVQSLYETYKVVTYPRTSSKYLPNDYKKIVKDTLSKIDQLSVFGMGKFAKEALDKDYISNVGKKVFDSSKVSDHFAIIPTLQQEGAKKLPDRVMKIYLMILQRFIAVFYPPAEFLNVTRISEVQGEFFKTEGKTLVKPGFKVVYQQENQDKLLEPLDSGKASTVKDLEILDLKTNPPAQYSEATLLSAMESAGRLISDEDLKEAIKDSGIGTPATRASIIEKLVDDRYIVREEGALVPTAKALRLHDLIDAMRIQELGSPELTGDWESKLLKIERGEFKRSLFMKEIEKEVSNIVSRVQAFNEDDTKKPSKLEALGKKFQETLSEYVSEDGTLSLRKVIGGRTIALEEMKILLEEKKIGPLEGFRSRRGFPFSAMLILDEENKIQFKFEEEVQAEDLKGKEVIGEFFLDKSPVYMLDTQYVSLSSIEGQKTGFKLSRVILGKEISKENAQRLLKGEKTELIEGFRSSKTKRLFNAFLNLNAKGQMEFSFEEKKPKTASKSKAKTTATKSASTKTKKTASTTKAKSTKTTTKKSSSAKAKTTSKKK